MKILYITSEYRRFIVSGKGIYVSDLSSLIKEKVDSVSVCMLTPRINDDILYEVVDDVSIFYVKKIQEETSEKFAQQIEKIQEVFTRREYEFDLIHICDQENCKFAAVLAEALNIPYVTTVFDLPEKLATDFLQKEAPLSPDDKKLIKSNIGSRRAIIKDSSAVIFCHNEVMKNSRRIFSDSFYENNVNLIPIGIDSQKPCTSIMDEEDYSFLFYPNETIILYAGFHFSHKELLLVFNAFSLLHKNKEDNFRLVVAGWGDANIFYQFALEHGFSKNVSFIGIPDENMKFSFYEQCAVGIVSSLDDQMQYAALEIMVNELPLVVIDSLEIEEKIFSGKNCLKLQLSEKLSTGDIEALVTKIEFLLNDENHKPIIENAVRFAKKNKDWQKMAGDTYKVYSAVLSK